MTFDENRQELSGQKKSEKNDSHSKDYFDTSGSSFGQKIIDPYLEHLSHKTRSGITLNAHIPEGIKGTLLHYAITWNFYNSDYSYNTARQTLRKYRKVFQAFEKQNFTRFDDAQLLLKLSNCIKSLKDRDGNPINDQTACDLQRPLITPVRKILKTNLLNRHQRKLLSEMLTNTPLFVGQPSNARESLAEIHSNYQYTNQQYIDSIRTFCFKHMEMCTNLRSSFKNEAPDLYQEIKSLILKNHSANFEKKSYFTIHLKYQKKTKSDALEFRRILGAITEASLKLDDPFLMETLFLGLAFKNPNMSYLIKKHNGRWVLNKHVTHGYMRSVLSSYIDKNGLIKIGARRLKKRYTGKQDGAPEEHKLRSRVPMGTLSSISPLTLFMPYGLSELDALIGFLASERASSDSIKNFSLKDVCFVNSHGEEVDALATDATGVFVRLYKNRAKKKEQTEIYKRGSTLFSYLKSMVVEYDLAVSEGLISSHHATKPLDHFFHNDFSISTGSIFHYGASIRYGASFLQPIVIDGSHYSKLLVKHIYQPLLTVIRSFSLCRLDTKKYDTAFGAMSLSSIRQSRIYYAEAKDLQNYSVSDDFNLLYSEEIYREMEVEASQQQHLVSTRLNTYYSRSRDKLVIDIKSKFAAQVGDEMLKIAEEIVRFKAGSITLLNLNEAKALCGLSDVEEKPSAEEILAHADTINALVTDTGFLQTNGTTYIIKSPLHACLMKKKIDHIDNEIGQLMANNDRLVPNAIAQRILLSIMLLNFDKSVLAEGLKKYAVHNFQFPSLVVSLGGFE